MKNDSDNVMITVKGKYIPEWAGQLVSSFLDYFDAMCSSHEECEGCPLFSVKCDPYAKSDNFDFEAFFHAVIDFIKEE